MTAEKRSEPGGKAPTPPGSKTRKAWTPRSPIENILEQVAKQEKKVAAMQQELDAEKSMLNKLLQFKKGLES